MGRGEVSSDGHRRKERELQQWQLHDLRSLCTHQQAQRDRSSPGGADVLAGGGTDDAGATRHGASGNACRERRQRSRIGSIQSPQRRYLSA